MKVLRCAAFFMPLAIALAAGCSRKESSRVLSPDPAPGPEVLEAHWVTDRAALATAIRQASANPGVVRSLREAPNPRLTRLDQYAICAEGTVNDGSHVQVTVLPHIADLDSTHAVFVTLIERDGRQVAEVSEIILGRDPTSLETGFVPMQIGDRIGWFRGDEAYAVGSGGVAKLASQRRKYDKFIQCMLSNANNGCSTGASIAAVIAPEVPYSRAIGCGIGVAVIAIGCGLMYLG